MRLAVALALGGWAAACSAPDPEEPGRPPFILPKSLFGSCRPTASTDGGAYDYSACGKKQKWYVTQTIVDAPFATSAVSYIGQSETMEKITWRIEENWLVAERAYSLFRGDDDLTAGVGQHTDPVAKFRILGHLDMNHGQVVSNPRTSWADRAFMIVDFGVNASPRYDEQVFDATSYAITDPKSPDAPIYDEQAGYIEVTVQYSLRERTTKDPWSSQGYPICVNGEFMLCEPGQFKAKRSMWRVQDDTAFELKLQDNVEASRFQFFRKSFAYIDGRYLNTEFGKKFLVDRYNIFERSKDDLGKVLPFRARTVKPVVWYPGENYPAYLMPATEAAVNDWNEALKEAVNRKRYWECLQATGNFTESSAEAVKYCKERELDTPAAKNLVVTAWCPHNPVQDGDPELCKRGIPKDRRIRIGDVRFNTIQWLTATTAEPFSAVGWFNTDHETAEIISSTVYMSAMGVTSTAYEVATALQMMNGDLQFGFPFVDGDDIASLIQRQFSQNIFGPNPLSSVGLGLQSTATRDTAPPPWPAMVIPAKGSLGPVDLRARMYNMDLSFISKAGPLPDLDTSSTEALLASAQRRVDALAAAGVLGDGNTRTLSRERALWGTGFEDQLIDDEALAQAGIADPARLTPQGLREAASPLRARGGRPIPAHVVMEPERARVFDPIYQALASRVKGRPVGKIVELLMGRAEEPGDPQWVKDLLRRSPMRALIAHELGHCFGMRHNFSGSFDALNFPKAYWDIRGGAPKPRWEAGGELSADEINRGLLEQSYSSVMDYYSSLLERNDGLGRYDKAAVKFGYAGLVEVFTSDKAVQNGFKVHEMQLWHNGLFANGTYADGPTGKGIHYTYYPDWFGDLDKRSDVPLELLVDRFGQGTKLWTGDGYPAVPYRTCTDDDVLFATCRRDDRGADTYEIGLDRIQRYYAYYHNTHFVRGRLWVNPPDPYAKYMDYFQKLTATFLLNSQSVTDLTRLSTDRGFAATTHALEQGFEFLADVLTTPEMGVKVPRPVPGAGTLWRDGALMPDAGFTSIDFGVGRFYGTQLARADSGKGYLGRVRYFGSAIDKRAAVDALTNAVSAAPVDPTTQPSARDNTAIYSIVYPSQVNELVGSILARDFRALGPEVVDPRDKIFNRRRWVTNLTPWSPNANNLIDPQVPDNLRLYLRTVMMARLNSGPNTDFASSARVVVVGSGDDFTLPVGTPVVTFTDRSSGRTYRALSRLDSNANETGVAARMLRHAQALEADTLLGSPAFQLEAQKTLQRFVIEIEHLRALSNFYDRGGADPTQ